MLYSSPHFARGQASFKSNLLKHTSDRTELAVNYLSSIHADQSPSFSDQVHMLWKVCIELPILREDISAQLYFWDGRRSDASCCYIHLVEMPKLTAFPAQRAPFLFHKGDRLVDWEAVTFVVLFDLP